MRALQHTPSPQNEIGSGRTEPLGADEQEKTLAEESYFFLAFFAFLAGFFAAFFAFLAAIVISPRDLVVLPHNAGSTIVMHSRLHGGITSYALVTNDFLNPFV
jgi:hypothetical protein